MKYTFYSFAASDYACDTYGAGDYGSCEVEGSTTSSSPLANTGYDIIIPVVLAVSIVVAAIVLLVRRSFKKTQ